MDPLPEFPVQAREHYHSKLKEIIMSTPESDPSRVSELETKAADIEAKIRTIAVQAKADIKALADKLHADLDEALAS